jgi:hypothetical protein
MRAPSALSVHGKEKVLGAQQQEDASLKNQLGSFRVPCSLDRPPCKVRKRVDVGGSVKRVVRA